MVTQITEPMWAKQRRFRSAATARGVTLVLDLGKNVMKVDSSQLVPSLVLMGVCWHIYICRWLKLYIRDKCAATLILVMYAMWLWCLLWLTASKTGAGRHVVMVYILLTQGHRLHVWNKIRHRQQMPWCFWQQVLLLYMSLTSYGPVNHIKIKPGNLWQLKDFKASDDLVCDQLNISNMRMSSIQCCYPTEHYITMRVVITAEFMWMTDG